MRTDVTQVFHASSLVDLERRHRKNCVDRTDQQRIIPRIYKYISNSKKVGSNVSSNDQEVPQFASQNVVKYRVERQLQTKKVLLAVAAHYLVGKLVTFMISAHNVLKLQAITMQHVRPQR